MSVSVSWKIEKRLILVKFEKNVSIDQIEQACQEVSLYICAGEKPVHVLADLVQVTHYPHEFSKLAAVIPHMAEPNLGKTVLVRQPDSLLQLMMSVIRHAVRIDMRMFDSMDTALHYLNEADSTLNLDERTA